MALRTPTGTEMNEWHCRRRMAIGSTAPATGVALCHSDLWGGPEPVRRSTVPDISVPVALPFLCGLFSGPRTSFWQYCHADTKAPNEMVSCSALLVLSRQKRPHVDEVQGM